MSKLALLFVCISITSCGSSQRGARSPSPAPASPKTQEGAAAKGDFKPEAAPGLLGGSEIAARSIDASGGAKALEAVTSRISNCMMEMPAIGLKGSYQMKQKSPNLFHLVFKPKGRAANESGSNGAVAWERGGQGALRVLDGDELTESLRIADMHGDLHWNQYFESATTASLESYPKGMRYRVIFKKREGGIVTRFYDAKSFLMVREERVVPSSLGPISSEVKVSDYRRVGRLKLPFRFETLIMKSPMVIQCANIKHNQDIAEDVFALPDDVRALTEAADKAKETAIEKEATSEG